ncbi:putative WD40/YVTN repeat-like-containing domain-containing protein [Heracleum sosnowskyi]|uniref:WD40/YVTN repeat-like-containing domain-containing protein n=1 Tax=Heracleum sosnowskyi TaxID=360622 RepID=A0AAD8H0Q1_9APIA|nr:putative WD40/YVTN repeat-like-containing domain-containing protein [Heracleum sosnowskyi]
MTPSFSAGLVPLPQSSISQTTSLLYDPPSSSLALLHSDTSISLYPSFSPTSLSSSSLSFPQTFISSPTSSATFLPLLNPTHRRLLFLVISPSHSPPSLLLRFWILKPCNNRFVRAHVECNYRLLNYDNVKSGVVFSVSHGASVKVVAMSNVFVLYCVSSMMVYVFAMRVSGGEESESVKLMKTGVVECCLPVFSVGVSSRFLVLGEFEGVRVFPMQGLVKGRVKKSSAGRLVNLNDGKVNGGDKNSVSTKLRSARLRQDSKEGCAGFVSFKEDGDSFNSNELQKKTVKAINIEALSPNEFLVMDSAGRIHHLRLSNSVLGSEVSCCIDQLSLSIKVHKIAVLPGISSRAQTLWISDGQHTVHTISLSDPDSSINGGDKKDDDRKLMQISVASAIFSSETIQQLVPTAANAILILGQGSIFAYTIS